MCPAGEREVFQSLAVGIYLGVGGGEQEHFQSEQVRSSPVKEKEATCPKSQRALKLLTVTESSL